MKKETLNKEKNLMVSEFKELLPDLAWIPDNIDIELCQSYKFSSNGTTETMGFYSPINNNIRIKRTAYVYTLIHEIAHFIHFNCSLDKYNPNKMTSNKIEDIAWVIYDYMLGIKYNKTADIIFSAFVNKYEHWIN